MREIARASSISQPLVHYHFGSQEGLYRAVRERLLKEGLGSVLSFSEGSPGCERSSFGTPSRHVRLRFGP
ncbi:MAG: helix-turn-helix transcriptional regulator [Syntrophobacteraceae bacterium]|nr:helix-turn-helix transcriptional regulator [Syntrophobacteraceae bacterium]